MLANYRWNFSNDLWKYITTVLVARSSWLIITIPRSGDHSAAEPPVPIPNTEVKRCSPDGSASIGCARVGRRQYYQLRFVKASRSCFFWKFRLSLLTESQIFNNTIELNSNTSSLSRRESREGWWGKAGFEYNVEQYHAYCSFPRRREITQQPSAFPAFAVERDETSGLTSGKIIKAHEKNKILS